MTCQIWSEPSCVRSEMSEHERSVYGAKRRQINQDNSQRS